MSGFLTRGRIVLFGSVVVVVCSGLDGMAEQPEAQRRPVLNFVGVTAHAWGAWVRPGVMVEDWVEEARGLCAPEEYCEVNGLRGRRLGDPRVPGARG